MNIAVHHADCVAWLTEYAERIAAGEAGPFDSCVTDPPYHLTSIVKRFGKNGSAAVKVPEGGTGAYARASKGFMGKEWDGGDVAFRPETWRAVFDCLKPGAHLVAFSGTRTYHRMACAIEDAGFEIRDQLAWVYGSGFPKSHSVSKGIDKAAGVEREKSPTIAMQKGGALAEISKNLRCAICGKARASGNPCVCPRLEDVPVTPEAAEWQGWGTALKPACEPICLARKPLSEKSVAANVLRWGTGALNVDGCRVEGEGTERRGRAEMGDVGGNLAAEYKTGSPLGRWPANIVHDGSAEVMGAFPAETGKSSGGGEKDFRASALFGGKSAKNRTKSSGLGDAGSAARFFYSAKAGPLDRLGSKHPTVKPVDLMRWLCRLITPPGGAILDPFAGSGTTGIASLAEGYASTMIELEDEYCTDIARKLAWLRGEGSGSLAEHLRRRASAAPDDMGPLFAGDAP